jgi:hypothetical protein
MNPDDLSKILSRHDSFEVPHKGLEDMHIFDVERIHQDREALIAEVERLHANFEQVIYALDDFLNRNARMMESDKSHAIRSIAQMARGLR